MYTVMRTGYRYPYENRTDQTGKYRNTKKESSTDSASSISDTACEEEPADILASQERNAKEDTGADKQTSPLSAKEQKETDALQEFIKRMQEAAASIKNAYEDSGKTNLYDATMDLMLIANAEKEPALRSIYARLLFKSRAIRSTSGADSDEIRIALRKIGKVIGKTKTKIKKLQKEELI